MPYDKDKDPMHGLAQTPSTPARRAVAVTPDDNTDLSIYAKALFVGVGGDIVAIPAGNADNEAVTFKNCASGSVLPVMIRRVKNSSTTATTPKWCVTRLGMHAAGCIGSVNHELERTQ